MKFHSLSRPELADSLLEKGRRMLGMKKRAELYKRFHAVIANEKPCIFLYYDAQMGCL